MDQVTKMTMMIARDLSMQIKCRIPQCTNCTVRWIKVTQKIKIHKDLVIFDFKKHVELYFFSRLRQILFLSDDDDDAN